MTQWTVWTPEDDAMLVTLRREGKTATQIAKALGRTPAAVKNRSRVLGAFSVKLESAPQIKAWPNLPADAFKSYRLKPDPGTVSKPQTRTLGGVVGVL